MAIFCLSTSLEDLKKRLGNIVVRLHQATRNRSRARDLKAHGAMTVLLKDALAPNLVQTLENNPAFIHGGPFANIAHGCNSVLATQTRAQARPTTWSPRRASAPTWAPRSSSTSSAASRACGPTRP